MELFDILFPDIYEVYLPACDACAGDDGDESRAIPLDVIESETEYTIHAEVPGYTKEELKLSVQDRILEISATKKPAAGAKDGDKVDAHRSIELPLDADLAKEIDARMENGLLIIAIARQAPVPKKEIKVKS